MQFKDKTHDKLNNKQFRKGSRAILQIDPFKQFMIFCPLQPNLLQASKGLSSRYHLKDSRPSEQDSEEVLGAIVDDSRAVGPVVDLRKQDDVNDHLEEGEGDIGSKVDPEGDAVEVVVLAGDPEVGKVIPVVGERSKDGDSHEHRVGATHELAIEKAHENPSHKGWQEVFDLVVEPSLVEGNVGLVVEEHPEEACANAHPHAVQTEPAHGTSIILIANEIIHSVFSVAHLSIFNKLIIYTRRRI